MLHAPSSAFLVLVPQLTAFAEPTPSGLLSVVADLRPLSGSYSLTFGDLDADGRDEALAIGADGTVTLLWNAGGGRFEDLTVASGLGELDFATCALLADLDGDGDLDLFAGSSERRLWRNLGNAAFEAVGAPEAGIDHAWIDLGVHTTDVDGDGGVDLLVHTEAGELLYRNRGDATFERAELPGLEPARRSARVASGREGTVDPDEPLDVDAALAASPASKRSQRWRRWKSAFAAPEPLSVGVTDPGTVEFAGSAEPLLASCLPGLRDQASGACLRASSVPVLGRLYPLSEELFVDAATGHVGVGTTTPGYALEVAGQLVSGVGNVAAGANAAVGGGSNNTAPGQHATVAGGDGNQALADHASIGGGLGNVASGTRAAIAGGVGNRAGSSAAVGGGQSNDAQVGFGTIAGGRYNTASATYAAIGGGANNQATGTHAVVGGGGDGVTAANGNLASGLASTVPGGRANVAAGATSMAAGQRAKALHDGSFVWADSQASDLASTGVDQFLVRAAGGVGIGTDAPTSPLTVGGAIESTSGGFRFPDGSLQTSAVRGTGLPSGYIVLSDTDNLRAGFTDTGFRSIVRTGLDEWTSGPPMLQGSRRSAHAVQGERLYVFGGDDDGSGGVEDSVFEYDSKLDLWMSLNPMPGGGRGEMPAVPLANGIFVPGGLVSVGVDPTDLVEVYDPPTNAWSTAAPMPIPVQGHAAAACGGKLYVFGGVDGTFTTQPLVAEYDPLTDTWTTRGAYPTGYAAVAVSSGDRIYVFGGLVSYQSGVVSDEVHEYRPATDSWLTLPAMATPRWGAAAAAVGSRIYVVGGRQGLAGPDLVAVEELDTLERRWSGQRAVLPAARFGPAAGSIGGELFVAGGSDGGSVLPDLFRYDPATVELRHYRAN